MTMGFFGGKRPPAAKRRPGPPPERTKKDASDGTRTRLAFVLLERGVLPDPNKVAEAFAFYAAPGEQIRESESDGGGKDEGERSLLSFVGPGNALLMAMMMPMPIPGGEAEGCVQYSLSSFKDGWELPPYEAHLMVTMMGGEGSPVDTLTLFTAFIAALTATSSAVGVYWGNGGATHSREFLLGIAEERETVPRLMLWSGISIARQQDGRLSLLSLGMSQLGLPDLLLTPKAMAPAEAIMTLYDLLAYCLSLGKPIPAGNTVGRTVDERIPVRYVPSPRDRSVKVMQVDGM
jgi:hypothetical protein